jgi:NhaA family Na+:H+ antiporter
VWALVHEAGIHATVAGVALGLLTRVKPDPGEDHSPAERVEHRVRPFSAGFAVPVFAFLSAGVAIELSTFGDRLADPLLIGIVVGLVLGKLLGVFGGAWLTARFTRAELDPSLRWVDMVGLSLVSGVGFTVSLLIADLAFKGDEAGLDTAKSGVFLGSLLAAFLAAIILKSRDRAYRLAEGEGVESDDPT